MKFIGRKRELQELDRQYRSDVFEFSVIYGRRRIGKTWLIRKFVEDKDAIFFSGLEASWISNLESMSHAVHQFFGQEGLPAFRDFSSLFTYLGRQARDRRLVFIIDEYPYLAGAAKEISSVLQRLCDHEWINSKLHLILCGSSMSFMERQVLGVKSPLYGRRTAQIKLQPFTWFESRQYLREMMLEDSAILHCATGGVAEYLSFIEPDATLADNLTRLFLVSSGRLYEEPSNLLKQELREPRVYNDLLDAIASGSSKSNEIATKAHLPSSAMNHYLDSLIDLNIITKERPIQNEQSRKTIYRIQDGCFRFWYRYVMPNLNAINAGLGQQVYSKIVQPDLANFMGQGFEQIFFDAFDWWNQAGQLPDLFVKRGRWWGNNPVEKREEEIDLVATGTKMICCGEVKWHNEKTDVNIIRQLEKKSLLLKGNQYCYIVLSRSGFTEHAIRYAEKRTDIMLRSLVDLDI